MEENNETNYDKPMGLRVGEFVGHNMCYLLLFLTCVALFTIRIFVFNVEFKDPLSIITDSIIDMILGFSITTLFGNQGLKNGELSIQYQATLEKYGQALDTITPYIERLSSFCEDKNKTYTEVTQKAYLRSHCISYDKWKANTLDYQTLTKKQKKALRVVERRKYSNLTSEWLLSNMQDKMLNYRRKPISKSRHKRNRDVKNLFTKFGFAVVFGCISLQVMSNPSIETIILTVVQLVVWLVLGYFQYLKDFEFIAEDFRGMIIYKINHLLEFNNKIKDNPNAYKDKFIEEVEVNDK